MKKLKLVLATVLVFVMTFALVACSSPVVGTWELVERTSDGVEEDGVSMTIEVNADGTLFMTIESAGETMEGECYWTFEDDTLYIYEDEDEKDEALEFKYEDGKLIYEMTRIKMIFEKK